MLIAVVVRARARLQEAEPVAERRELCDIERVGHRLLEPAVHAGADTAQHDASLPRLREDAVETVDPPDGEQVRRAPAADVHDVLLEDERAEIGDRAAEELEIGRAAVVRGERAVEARDVALGIAARGRDEADARAAGARSR
jgi:hypothetical protein